MSLNETAAAAVNKKVTLLDASFGRFAVRSILTGVYLVIGTALPVLGQAVEKHAEGLGAPVFALFFGLGLLPSLSWAPNWLPAA
ncbi:formate/nitrite transporter family protein [Corynebacterium diphtheriae]|nr:formate/nitrite transporter family protein [Corynebacterium diphtheriae]